jgi:glycosyltransferase involved in cell wall biosynthesis
MFGWEFPPFNTGGLGTACYGLTKGLTRQGVDITLVLPRIGDTPDYAYLKILSAEGVKNLKFRPVDSVLKPYVTCESYIDELRYLGLEEKNGKPVKHYLSSKAKTDLSTLDAKRSLYGRDLFHEVYRYAKEARSIAAEEDYDVIHCHDWLTYPAGMAALKVAKGRGIKAPLVAHIHATEFDRTGGYPDGRVYHIEKEGMSRASSVLAVSNYTKNIVVGKYQINPAKIQVVHNSIDYEPCPDEGLDECCLKQHHPVVLFLGRMTIQKGPDHFLKIAKRVSEVDPDVRFVMSGGGDMFSRIVEESANLGIGDKVLFTDHVSGTDVDKAYRMADVYVMSSISEPFGLTVLESMKNKTPVVVAKQSGVSEVVKNCLIADFWDVDEMANKILAVLNYPALKESLVNEGLNEIKSFSWDHPARKCVDAYKKAITEAA